MNNVSVLGDIYTAYEIDIDAMIRNALDQFHKRYHLYPTDLAISNAWKDAPQYYWINIRDPEEWNHYLSVLKQKSMEDMISSRVTYTRWMIAIHKRKDVQINEVRSVRLGEL